MLFEKRLFKKSYFEVISRHCQRDVDHKWEAIFRKMEVSIRNPRFFKDEEAF
jgi:hypothetical protein